MTRYFLTVRNSITVRDTEGSNKTSLAEVIEEAREAARQLWADGIRRGRDRRNWSIDIEDSDGRVLQTVRFIETAKAD